MYKKNKWTSGRAQLVFPLLGPDLKGKSGCRIENTIFDPRIGEEVFVVIIDEPTYAQELADTKPFNLFCKSGMVRTSQGIILFLLFTITGGSDEVATFETLLNPHKMSTINLLSAWSQQSHLKVVILDNQRGKELNWYEFENNYGMDTVVKTISQCIGHEKEGDFMLAQQEFYRDYDLDDLKDM